MNNKKVISSLAVAGAIGAGAIAMAQVNNLGGGAQNGMGMMNMGGSTAIAATPSGVFVLAGNRVMRLNPRTLQVEARGTIAELGSMGGMNDNGSGTTSGTGSTSGSTSGQG